MDFNQILELIRTVSASELTAFQYEEGNQKILMHTGNVIYNGTMMDVNGVSATAAAGSAGAVSMNSANAANVAGASAVAVNGAATTAVAAGVSAEVVATSAQEGSLVKAPLVGRFYVAPSEDAEPFVKVGDTVKKGQTLAIVEAMKLMNEIESEYDGVVAEVLVSDAEAVEYGQPLFRIV